MDNLTVHKMNQVRYVYDRLDIMPIFNIPYCAEFNPIESVFSQVKRVFKLERLKKLANLEPFDAEKTIEDIFWKLKPETILPCIRKSQHLLETV